jgi:hypothetical protein
MSPNLKKQGVKGEVVGVPNTEFHFIYQWRKDNRNADGNLPSIAEARDAFKKRVLQ